MVLGSSLPARRWGIDRVVLLGAGAALALPFVAAAAVVLTQHWFPSSDMALLELRTLDVGGPDTPLLGAYSRLGWNHPGPLEFWVLAAPLRLFGGTTTGMLLGAVAVNALAAGGSIIVARRHGARVLAVIVTMALALLVRGTGAAYLFHTWNPYLPVLPTAFLIMATWAVVEGDLVLLPVVVGVACFAAQTHVGFVPVVGALAILALGAAARRLWADRRRPRPAAGRRRTLAILAATAATAAVCLAPALLEQLTHDPGNLRAIVDSLDDAGGAPVGPGRAAGIAALRLAPAGPWVSGDDPVEYFTGAADGVSPWWLLAPLAGVAGGLAVARRGRSGPPARFLGVAAVAAVAAGAATVRTTGEPYVYLLQWFRPAAAMLWAAVVWIAVGALGRLRVRHPTAPRTARVLAALLAATVFVVVALAAASSLFTGLGLRLPDAWQSAAVAAVGEPTVAATGAGTSAQLDFSGPCAREVGDGLALQLVHRGVSVRVDPTLASAYGESRAAAPADPAHPADRRVEIVCGPAAAGRIASSPHPPVGTYQVVSPEAEAEAVRLQARLAAQLAAAGRADIAQALESGVLAIVPVANQRALGLDPAEVSRYDELLGRRQHSVAVFVAPG
jgi:hypothetical protein